jgi:hypothetical protein
VLLRSTLTVLALTVVASLGGCSEDSGGEQAEGRPSRASSSTAKADPSKPEESDAGPSGDTACSLLTADAVAEVVGTAVQDGIAFGGSPSDGADRTGCTWYSEEDPTEAAAIYVYSTPGPADEAFRPGDADVPGIGDKAFADALGGVWFYVGNRSAVAQWTTYGTPSENQPKSEALAKLLVAALQ